MSVGSVPPVAAGPQAAVQLAGVAIVSCFYSEILHQGCNKSPSVSRPRFCLFDTWWLQHLQTATVSKQPWQVTGRSRTSCFVGLIDGQHYNACRDGYIQESSKSARYQKHVGGETGIKTSHPNPTVPAFPYLRRSLPLKAEKLGDPIRFPMSRPCFP